jgi:SAM-dependent methyltransferase
MQSELKGQHLPWCCPDHGHLLTGRNRAFRCPEGCSFPLVNDIVRFVPQNNYAASFGLQWNEYRTTQLDSHTGLSISHDRLKRLLGGSFDILKGKVVLEAGCGAGRFTEIMLQHGANVFAVDLSTAVDANYKNCSGHPNYFVCQADILRLPVPTESFDIVACIGVIQHTPDPEETIQAICSHVKPGGLLVMDHYAKGYPQSLSRKRLRSFMLKRSERFGMSFCLMLVGVLWPVHRLLWRLRGLKGMQTIRKCFLQYSPLVDYHDAYPQLGPQLLREWAILDTHDTLTDVHKHLRGKEEIEEYLKQYGMTDIEVNYGGNGVEARAKKSTHA